MTLFELHEHFRRVVALNFRDPLWLTAEIAQAGMSKGHFYLSLIQKNDDETGIVAQADAVMWARDLRRLQMTHGAQLMQMALSAGAATRLYVRVDFHERYGYKLIVEDIDPAFTLGQLALQRRQTIAQLQQEGAMTRNRSIQLPAVLQHIAVISSEEAAGFQDFNHHLTNNPFGYQFRCTHFFAAVQGKSAAGEIIDALTQVAARYNQFDGVVIVRGGGAKLDLAAFDDLELCRNAAQMPLPVLTGIGHDIDESVLDLVAHTALKTPTAVADFIVQRSLEFEQSILYAAAGIRQVADARRQFSQTQLDQTELSIRAAARAKLQMAAVRLDQAADQLPVLARQLIRQQQFRLDQAEALCAAHHPDMVLRRGYTLTLKAGQVVTSATDIQPGDRLETRWSDGTTSSTVES